MAKSALNLLIKAIFFTAIMLVVAKVVPYEPLAEALTGLFDYQRAEKLTAFVLGEPDSEAWESLYSYFSVFINILISVPVMSAMLAACNVIIRKARPAHFLQAYVLSTSRYYAKVLTFIVLFWAFFRLLPYQALFPTGQAISGLLIAAITAFNLLITLACYCFITKKMTIKRSL